MGITDLNLQQIYHRYCHLLPPGIDSISSFLVNLPIIMFFIISFPIRYFICLFLSVSKVSPLCVLYNIFPFISLVCPFLGGEISSENCYGNCPGCNTQSKQCLGYNKTIGYMCIYCAQTSQSILNSIFCTLGDIIGTITYPFLLIINIFLGLFLKQSICFTFIPCGESNGMYNS